VVIGLCSRSRPARACRNSSGYRARAACAITACGSSRSVTTTTEPCDPRPRRRSGRRKLHDSRLPCMSRSAIQALLSPDLETVAVRAPRVSVVRTCAARRWRTEVQAKPPDGGRSADAQVDPLAGSRFCRSDEDAAGRARGGTRIMVTERPWPGSRCRRGGMEVVADPVRLSFASL